MALRPNYRVNQVTGLGTFLRELDGPVVDAADAHVTVGDPATRTSAVVSPRAPGFADCLEPGVRDLVLTLLENWKCVTYSSCEGHPEELGRPPAPCEVGILPRDDGEMRRIEHKSRALAAALTSVYVELLYETTPLESPVGSHQAAQLVFWPRHGWDAYFTHLADAVTETRRNIS